MITKKEIIETIFAKKDRHEKHEQIMATYEGLDKKLNFGDMFKKSIFAYNKTNRNLVAKMVKDEMVSRIKYTIIEAHSGTSMQEIAKAKRIHKKMIAEKQFSNVDTTLIFKDVNNEIYVLISETDNPMSPTEKIFIS